MYPEELNDSVLRKTVSAFFSMINSYLSHERFKDESHHQTLAEEFFKKVVEKEDDKHSFTTSFLKAWKKMSTRDKTYTGLKRQELLFLEWYLHQEIVKSTEEINRLIGLLKDPSTEIKKNKEKSEELEKKYFGSFIGAPPTTQLIQFVKEIKTDKDIEKEVFDHNEQIRSNIASILEILFNSLKSALKNLGWLEIPVELFGFLKLPRFFER